MPSALTPTPGQAAQEGPNFVKEILGVFASISTPLALAGLALAVLFLVIRQLIKANTFPALTAAASTKFGRHIIDRLFTFAVIAAVLGFAGFALQLVYRPVPVVENGGTKDIIYQGAVTDAATHQPIEAATISFRDHHEIPQQTTDSEGAFYFQLPPRSFNAKATAAHPEYRARTLLVILRPGTMESDDRFKLTALSAAQSSTSPTVPTPPVSTPTAVPAPPVETPAVKFHYRKWNGQTWFDGYFERGARSLEWREYNTHTADEFHFNETQGEPDFFTLHDASRNFYVRIPRNGGRVEGSIAISGPWGPFLTAERVAF